MACWLANAASRGVGRCSGGYTGGKAFLQAWTELVQFAFACLTAEALYILV